MNVTLGVLVYAALQIITAARAITRKDREPASRVAWLLVVMALPGAGIALYFLFGETNIGDRTRKRMAAVSDRLQSLASSAPVPVEADNIPPNFEPVFRRAAAVNGFIPVSGNEARLEDSENSGIDAVIADIDAATEHVHLLFYIWLEDGNGKKMLDAVERAAARGVTCRLLIDGLGSRQLARSKRWTGLTDKGVSTAITFKMRWLLIHIFFARIDLRNHRKIVVIDGKTAYVGSQNCADPEFRVKPRFAPWVDILLRINGPVVRQMQQLFVADWMTHSGEDIADLLTHRPEPAADGFGAVVVGTGPTIDSHAVSDIFGMFLAAARREVIITTPYYVPDDHLHRSICGAALRGVAVTMIVPKNNDSWFVARASHSYYDDLISAGVRLAEYREGLLHAKTLTVDGVATCIGSANMDRRSFELNYENNLLLLSETVTANIRTRQLSYLQRSDICTIGDVSGWSWPTRALNNMMATVGPLL